MKKAYKILILIGIMLTVLLGICFCIYLTLKTPEPQNTELETLYVGVTEGDYTYTVFSDYTCEITGYSGTDTKLKVPRVINTCTVVGIGSHAFENCSTLMEVKLPSTVRYIEYRAFADCGLLKEVSLPKALNYVGIEAFYDSDELQKVVFKGDVTKVETSAFEGCDSIVSVFFKKGVGELGNRAFFGCLALTEIELGNDLSSVGNYAFGNCRSLTEADLGETLTEIGLRAFDGCTSLSEIVIPDTVTKIGRYAFEGTPWRENASGYVVVGKGILAAAGYDIGADIVIPDGVLFIGDAFEGRTDITSLVVSDTVTEIGDGAFMGCTSLSSAVIPDSVSKLGSYVFYGCESLGEVSLPSGLSDVGVFCFTDTLWVESGDFVIGGDGILFGCNVSGKNVTVPENVKYIAEAFFETEYRSVTLCDSVEKILPHAFGLCETLEKVLFGSNITEIGEGAFSGCSGLSAVTLYDGLVTLEKECFADCYALDEINLPSSLEYVGEDAFVRCESLKDVVWDVSENAVIENGNEALTNLIN